MFVNRPGRALLHAVFWCAVWGMCMWMSIFHTPHADYFTKLVMFGFGLFMFSVAAFCAATVVRSMVRGAAAVVSTAWGRP